MALCDDELGRHIAPLQIPSPKIVAGYIPDLGL